MEEQCALGLIDQRGDMPDIDRLMQVDEFAGLAQAVEELTEILPHLQHLQSLSLRQRTDSRAPQQRDYRWQCACQSRALRALLPVEGEPEPLSPSGAEASMNAGDEPVLTMKALRPFVPARD